MFAITEVDLSTPSATTRGKSYSGTAARGGKRPLTLGPTTSDEALIKAIACGERGAMELLYSRHSVRVYRFSLRITGNPTVAEDIASDVFLEVWRHAEAFKANSQVSTWLLAITRNKSLSALRRRVDAPLEDDWADAVEDTADDPETSVHNNDRSTVIQKCLSELSPAQREVIDLVYYHEKSVEEVAQIVGVPVGTVKTRMFYARHRMADLLNAAGFKGL